MRTIRSISLADGPQTMRRAVGDAVQWLDGVAYVRLEGEDRVWVVEGDRPSGMAEMLAVIRERAREST